MILLGLLALSLPQNFLVDGFLSTVTFADEQSLDASPHEVRNTMINPSGYEEAWVKIQNPLSNKDPHELPLELNLPLCNAKSVKRLDQYCVMSDGRVAMVTSILGRKISVNLVDLNTPDAFQAFSAKIRKSPSSRMPASLADKEIFCEASCPEIDTPSLCQGSGVTVQKAYQDLQTAMNEKSDSACLHCNLKAVVCDGFLYQAPNAK